MELAKSQEQRASHNSLGQQETSSFDRMNDILHKTLEERTRLTLQIKTLEDELQKLKRELQTTQNEAANKTKEMDVLRNYLRGSEQRQPKKERDVQETDTEMKKHEREKHEREKKEGEKKEREKSEMEKKDSMICRYVYQIEELQVKNKRIPQLASQIYRLEALNATLSSTLEQKEKEIGDDSTKLKSALMDFDSKASKMESRYEKNIAEVKASKSDANEKEKKRALKRVVELQTENEKLAEAMKHSIDSHNALKEEKKILKERVSRLEKVRAEQRSILGIVFSVDLSGSLGGNPHLLAKDVFRKLINDLRSKFPKAHVGVVVHAYSVYIARQMSEVDSYTSSVLDSIVCEGSENYAQAFNYVVFLLSTFKDSYPEAKRRVVMISDGQGYSALTDVSTLSADEVPCHNIVVGNLYSTSTQECSSITGGKNFRYSDDFGISDIDALIYN